MTPQHFVDVVHEVVYRSAVNDVVANLSEVPRGADATLGNASAWYNALPPDARAHARAIAEMAAHHALFGLFCVLDGVRAAESTRDKGRFILAYNKGGVATTLNPPNGELLHDLLNDAVARDRR